MSAMRPEGDPRRCRSPGDPPAPARVTPDKGLRRVSLEASCLGNTRAELFERGGSRSRERLRMVGSVFLQEPELGLCWD